MSVYDIKILFATYIDESNKYILYIDKTYLNCKVFSGRIHANCIEREDYAMKNMKKFAALFLALSMAVGMTACGSSKKEETTTQEDTQKKEETKKLE